MSGPSLVAQDVRYKLHSKADFTKFKTYNATGEKRCKFPPIQPNNHDSAHSATFHPLENPHPDF
jgi:hypothetical protein